jgi:hypothetical protein
MFDHRGAARVLRPALIALSLVLLGCSGPPGTVEEITIANPTSYDLAVEVAGRARESWLPVAIVEAGSEDAAQQVLDRGEVWVFRFLHWGEPVTELTMTRTELERNGWRVDVPAEVEERLEELGRPPAEEVTGVPPGGGG